MVSYPVKDICNMHSISVFILLQYMQLSGDHLSQSVHMKTNLSALCTYQLVSPISFQLELLGLKYT